jgi:hypothetical protein
LDAGHHVSDPDDVAAVRAAVLAPALRPALFRLEVVGRENLAPTGAPNVEASFRP